MIISDLSVLQAVEESANIQGGDSSSLFLPLFAGTPGTLVGATNAATASASGTASNPFSTGSIIGVSLSASLAQTTAVAVLGGGSQSTSVSGASITFSPGPNGAPLLLRNPLTITNP